MELILAALIVLGILAFVAYPLFAAPREEIDESPGALDGLLAQRDAAYDAIRDLDFDFQMGKLSESDYSALREKYKARAATALQEIDAIGGDGAGAEIEAEVAQVRAARRAAPSADDAIEREIARMRAGKGAASDLRCPNCRTPYRVGDAYCAKCGKKLPA